MARRRQNDMRPLHAEERQVLERITQARSERVDRVGRAVVLLAVAGGHSYSQAAQQAGWHSHGGVGALVRRFNASGLAALTIAAGRGRRPTYLLAARQHIVAVAQQAPDRQADQTATWSLSTLKRRLRREGFTRIGATTIRRVLQDAGSSYQRTRTWCPTGTALRKRKTGVVQVVDPRTEEKKV